ncbi:hypothetical protein CPC197_0892B, partial [Chlamydia psittaci C1/97]
WDEFVQQKMEGYGWGYPPITLWDLDGLHQFKVGKL